MVNGTYTARDETCRSRLAEKAKIPHAGRPPLRTAPPALHELARAVGGAGAIFFGEKERALQWVNSPGLDVLIEGWTKGGWHERNERGERLARVVHSGFVLDSAQFTEEERRTLPVYDEFMRPHGLGTGAGTVIRVPTGDKLLFVVERYLEDGDFTQDHVACLDALRPHLARSALIASRRSPTSFPCGARRGIFSRGRPASSSSRRWSAAAG